MARMWIVQGDPTTSGGTVVNGSPFSDIDGIPVARVGDKAVCPLHKGTFPIVDGDSTMIVDGQAVALHGSSLACGCKVISARQMHVFVDAGASAAGTRPVASAASGGSKDTFDEGFVLRAKLTNKPLANRNYRIIHADGRVEAGTTDERGATHVVASDCCETLRIELEEEGP